MPETAVEWRIENLSHWCAEVHGHCIQSPWFFPSYNMHMQLYPKGTSGQGEKIVVRLCGLRVRVNCELSLYSTDGFLMCSQQYEAEKNPNDLELPPYFEFVRSRIRRSGDLIILMRIGENDSHSNNLRLFTTINVLKITLEINPKWIEEMESDETRDFFYIQLSPYDNLDRVSLKICSKNNVVHFMIQPPTQLYKDPFAVEMSVSLNVSAGIVDSNNCAKKERVFPDNRPWTFPDPLEKKESVEKGISMFFSLKTENLIQSPFHIICANSCSSVESENKICFLEKAPSMDLVTSNKVLANDSGSQPSLTSDMPDYDSILVLSKQLMCVYQDQDFSDISLKCDNVTFPVHKVILSARSPVFKTMLSSDMKEAASGEVDIGDLDPSTLSRFLTYLYTGAVEDLQGDSALKLYYAADKYQVPSLKKDCSKFLCSNASVSNVCDILSLADKHSDAQLTSVAQEFILDNYNDVLISNEWESFMCRESLLAVKTLTHFAAKNSVRKHASK